MCDSGWCGSVQPARYRIVFEEGEGGCRMLMNWSEQDEDPVISNASPDMPFEWVEFAELLEDSRGLELARFRLSDE